MKLNKIFTIATLAASALFATSCSDDVPEYAGPGAWDANANYANVYFPVTSFSEMVDPAAEPKAQVVVARRNVSGALTVPVKIYEGEETFTVSDAVFEAGDTTGIINIDYSKAEIGKPYKLVIGFEGADKVSSYSKDIAYTYSVQRVKWNKVGYILDAAGNKVEGYATYTEDFMTTFYGVDNVAIPTRIEERDDKPGYFRLINTYHENYPYNDPGDWDETKDYYIYIDATNPKKVYIPHYCETGMSWSYGMISVSSLAGYYLANGKSDTAEDYYGTYEDGIITFPASSLLISMAGYNEGGFYKANSNGAFKVVLDPTKDVYTATLDDYEWEPMFSGEFTSAQLGTKKAGVTIYKGVPNDSILNADSLCYKRFEAKNGGTPYFIASPYTNGKHLLFLVKNKNIIVPDGYEYQETGLTALNQKVYANILGSSLFSEDEINLDIRFQTYPVYNSETKEYDFIDYGTATETLANITWTKVGTGTFTYLGWWDAGQDEEGNYLPLADPGYELFQRDGTDDTFKIADWGGGVDYIFTWNKKTNVCATQLGFIGASHSTYGEVYVVDASTYNSTKYPYEENPSQYVPEENTFYFYNAYVVSAGSFGVSLETFEVDWNAVEEPTAAARKVSLKKSPRTFGMKPNKNIKAANRFVGKKVTEPKFGKTLNPGTPVAE